MIVFTTFWDACQLVDSKMILFDWKNSIKKLDLISDPCNFSIHSVALAHPPFEKIPSLQNIFRGNRDRLNFFCPTYDLLHKYHSDKDWNYYTEKFNGILEKNRPSINNWLSSLEQNHIYILCCWEDTSLKANCHRKIIYERLQRSEIVKNKLILIYRNGGKVKKS